MLQQHTHCFNESCERFCRGLWKFEILAVHVIVASLSVFFDHVHSLVLHKILRAKQEISPLHPNFATGRWRRLREHFENCTRGSIFIDINQLHCNNSATAFPTDIFVCRLCSDQMQAPCHKRTPYCLGCFLSTPSKCKLQCVASWYSQTIIYKLSCARTWHRNNLESISPQMVLQTTSTLVSPFSSSWAICSSWA